MLTIICGEDSAASRSYFQKIKKEYLDKAYLLQNISYQEVPDITKGLADSQSLFNDKKVFIIENYDKKVKRQGRGKRVKDTETASQENLLKQINDSKDIVLIDWEDSKSTYDLKIAKFGIVKEFKPSSSIFNLVDACFPGNLNIFFNSINLVSQNEDDQFIFIMIARHIRNLILASENSLPGNIAPWQRAKLYIQAKKWQPQNLIKFYEGLHRIDVGSKTSSLPNSIKESLEILSLYIFLKIDYYHFSYIV